MTSRPHAASAVAGPAGPDAAVDYLAARTRRGRRSDPGLAPSSLRRRAAALKGFYAFAYGEGLIGVDVAAHVDLPGPSRLLPETLTVAETERLLEAAGGDDRRRPMPSTACATGPSWSCCTPPASGSARRSGSTGRTCRRTALSSGSSARATRNGSCRSARSPSTGSAAGSTAREPALLALGHVAPDRGGPLFLGDRGGRLARQQAWAAVKRAADARRPRRASQPAHPAPLVRDASARGRSRPAHRPGVARACEYLHHAALHASDRRTDPGRLQPGPSTSLRREAPAT